ncbi:MAG: phosphoadenosine phosphosulfate reductase family protein [Verrucomicrobiota bacterium]
MSDTPRTDEIFKTKWEWIVVNSSAGKDSQTALRTVVEECDQQGVSRDRIVVSHQDLGHMEWDGTRELVEKQAAHYGLRVEVSRYRNKDGDELSLLDYVRKRGKWPDSKNRFCTSEFKRGPGGRVITKLFRERPGPILNVYGFRDEESTARAKKQSFVRNGRFSTKTREVWDWLPIRNWSEGEVWRSIRESGVPHHEAYDLGMPRLSCSFCIFAPKAALMIAGRARPDLLNEYCDLEEEIGHTFQNGRSISEIRAAIQAGEIIESEALHGAWNM